MHRYIHRYQLKFLFYFAFEQATPVLLAKEIKQNFSLHLEYDLPYLTEVSIRFIGFILSYYIILYIL